MCGNGVVDPGEECDDGIQNSDRPNYRCRMNCSLARCGDGILDFNKEACDNGPFNGQQGDACTLNCTTVMLPDIIGSVIELPFMNGTTGSTGSGVILTGVLPPKTTDSGPGTIAIMAAGAALVYAYMKRRAVKRT